MWLGDCECALSKTWGNSGGAEENMSLPFCFTNHSATWKLLGWNKERLWMGMGVGGGGERRGGKLWNLKGSHQDGIQTLVICGGKRWDLPHREQQEACGGFWYTADLWHILHFSFCSVLIDVLFTAQSTLYYHNHSNAQCPSSEHYPSHLSMYCILELVLPQKQPVSTCLR